MRFKAYGNKSDANGNTYYLYTFTANNHEEAVKSAMETCKAYAKVEVKVETELVNAKGEPWVPMRNRPINRG